MSTPELSYPLGVLSRRAEDPSDAFPANVQYAAFGGDGRGWRSQLRTIRSEHLRELAQAMAADVTGPRNGFCVWESFRNADYCHLAFDIDIKPALPEGKGVGDVVAAVSRAVCGAFSSTYVQRRPTRFDCVVWCASRVGKVSYHLHYYRLRLAFSEQLSVARWVREQVGKDVGLAWLYVGMDTGPNERGHLRTPLSHKFDDDHLLSDSCLVLDGVYDRAGKVVEETRSDRCFWHGHSGAARLAHLVEACFHTTTKADYHDVLDKDDASGARKRWTVARARAARRAADLEEADPVADGAGEVVLTGVDMSDWREETMVPPALMVMLRKRLSTDDDPYHSTLRWFAQRAAVVGNALYYKVLDKTRMPTLEHHRLEQALYAQYPKVLVFPEGADKAKAVSFLQLFVQAHTVREHYRDLIMVPRGVLETERVDAQGKLNMWTGWKCDQWQLEAMDERVDEVEMDDTQPLHSVLYYLYHDLCNSVEEHFRAVLWYMAHLVQHPAEKTGRILVIYGPEGAGKTGFFVDLFLNQVLGRRHAVVLNSASDITGQFNSLLEGRIVCVAEEAMMADARSADALKDLTTGDTITINRKMVAQRQDTNYLNVILLSNNEVPLVVGKEARRPIIVHTSNRFSSMSEEDKFEYFQHRAEVLEDEKTARQFAWFLSRLDLTEWSKVRKSKMFFSREFDAMRVAALSPGLKLAFSIINSGSNGSSTLKSKQNPQGWWDRTQRSPWFENKVKEYVGDSHTIQQELIKLGCAFGTDDTTQFIAWPSKDGFVAAFCKLVPGIQPERLNVAPPVQPPVPALMSEDTPKLFGKMRPLTCEKARSLERAHSRAQMSQSTTTPPASPFRPRPRRRRVLDDSDDDLLVPVPVSAPHLSLLDEATGSSSPPPPPRPRALEEDPMETGSPVF